MNIWLNLNSRLQPQHRLGLERAIHKMLIKEVIGCVTGGRSFTDDNGEIIGCSIEIDLVDESSEDIARLAEIVQKFKIPLGSQLVYDEVRIPIGMTQGLGLYLNGVDLPAEVYQEYDVCDVVENTTKLLHEIGDFCSYWNGTNTSAIYFYGDSFTEMKEAIEGFLQTHPLCKQCRVLQIA